jgi:hypothetical protein
MREQTSLHLTKPTPRFPPPRTQLLQKAVLYTNGNKWPATAPPATDILPTLYAYLSRGLHVSIAALIIPNNEACSA